MNKPAKSKELELTIILTRIAKKQIKSPFECPGLLSLLHSEQWKNASAEQKAILLDRQYHKDYEVASDSTRHLMALTRMEIESALRAWG